MAGRWRRGRRRGPAAKGSPPGAAIGSLTDEGRIVVEPGITLWHRSVGEGDRTLVVPCTGNHLDLEGLCRSGWRVVFYDVRNRGRSDAVADRLRLGFTKEVADLGVVVEALGLGRYSLFGWSYHAGVVADHAMSNPDRVDRVVLAAAVAPRSSTGTRPGREPDPADLARLDQLQAAGAPNSDPEGWCRAWRQVYVPLLMGDRSGFDRLADPCAMANETPQHIAESMIAVFAELRDYDWRPALGALRAPTLVLHGDEDREPVDSAYEWAAAVADGRVEELVGVGQLPWAERPEELFGAVAAFLDG